MHLVEAFRSALVWVGDFELVFFVGICMVRKQWIKGADEHDLRSGRAHVDHVGLVGLVHGQEQIERFGISHRIKLTSTVRSGRERRTAPD